jgi:hypothetical protein
MGTEGMGTPVVPGFCTASIKSAAAIISGPAISCWFGLDRHAPVKQFPASAEVRQNTDRQGLGWFFVFLFYRHMRFNAPTSTTQWVHESWLRCNCTPVEAWRDVFIKPV